MRMRSLCRHRQPGVHLPTPASSLKRQKVSYERLVFDLQEKVKTFQETIEKRADRLSVLGETEYGGLQCKYRQAVLMGNLMLASTVVRELIGLVRTRLKFLKQDEYGQLQQMRKESRGLGQRVLTETIVSLIALNLRQTVWLEEEVLLREEEVRQLGYRLDAEKQRGELATG